MPKKNIGELAFLSMIVLYILVYYFADIAPISRNTHIKSFVLLIMGVLLALVAAQIIAMVKDKEFLKTITFQASDLLVLVKDPLLFIILSTLFYLALIPVVGFFVMSFIYIDAVIWFLNIRKKLILVVVPLAYNAIMFFCFEYLLDLQFPKGFLF